MQTKEEIAREVQDELSKAFAAFGYEILQALVTDIDPDPKVKAAMNEVSGRVLAMMTCSPALRLRPVLLGQDPCCRFLCVAGPLTPLPAAWCLCCTVCRSTPRSASGGLAAVM